MSSPTKTLQPVPAGKKALYFLDNNPFGASIVAVTLSDDGTLSAPKRTLFNGIGLLGKRANRPTNMDSLFSQDSVVVDGNTLFTISPGSDRVHMFAISPDDPRNLVPVGGPVPTGGRFPVSLAYSRKLGLLCVLHSGHVGGVSTFRVNDLGSENPGIKPLGHFFPLPIPQTATPPLGPTNTAGDIVFNPSQTAVFVLLKFDGVAKFPGHVFAFPVDQKTATLVPAPVQSRPAGLLAPYSITFVGNDDSRAILSDAAFGAQFIQVSYPSLEVTLTKSLTISMTSAPCWTAYAAHLDIMFVLGGFDPTPVAVDIKTQDIKYTITAPAETLGGFDSLVYGDYLYVLQGAAGISVFKIDANGGKLVQNLNLSALGSRDGWEGLAMYGK
ncbi:hypothetical protein F4776DRAFT_675026 [Hypoxylon sp. NC0597]|nr:hypothetical protein F4776DRAFT_675026 [Hypoxylon sp. NC0597]